MSSSRSERAAVGPFAIALVFLVTAVIWGIVLYPQLPDLVPVHWDAAGNVNRYADKSVWSVLGLPFIGILVAVLLFVIATTMHRFPQRYAQGSSTGAEENAATTEELAASVKSSAHAAQQAAGLAEQARSGAVDGGRIVGDAVQAIGRIDAVSRRIADITSVIEDIAFQTNLLALNAAVEAARAGDAGKGFAVVASEVRTLAQRSSEAARGIAKLIDESVSEVSSEDDTPVAARQVWGGLANGRP